MPVEILNLVLIFVNLSLYATCDNYFQKHFKLAIEM